MNQAAYVSRGFVNKKDLNRFKHRGFKYVAKRAIIDASDPELDAPVPEAPTDPDVKPARGRPIIFTAIQSFEETDPDELIEVEGYVPEVEAGSDEGGDERALKLQGSDTVSKLLLPIGPNGKCFTC